MIQQSDSKVKKSEQTTQVMERKVYITPRLITYGHLEKMTQSGTGGPGDFRNRQAGVRQG